MVKLGKTSPEVLIYVQNIKQYFGSHADAQKYFEVEGNEEAFFNHITEISQKNFEENGEPQLSLEQFEQLRRKISNFVGKHEEAVGIFISLGDLGYISLN